MSRALCFVVVVVAAVSGCNNTRITVLTQALAGRTATLDVETSVLRVTRGLAVALECTEYDETYSGPCRDLDVSLDGDDVADVFDVHLDSFGQNVYDTSASGEESLFAPATRSGVLLAARAAGEATVTLKPKGTPMSLSLVVEDAPGDEEEEDAPAEE